MNEINEIGIALVPIVFILAGVIAYFAVKYKWKIAEVL
jgi:hypothetical protein